MSQYVADRPRCTPSASNGCGRRLPRCGAGVGVLEAGRVTRTGIRQVVGRDDVALGTHVLQLQHAVEVERDGQLLAAGAGQRGDVDRLAPDESARVASTAPTAARADPSLSDRGARRCRASSWRCRAGGGAGRPSRRGRCRCAVTPGSGAGRGSGPPRPTRPPSAAPSGSPARLPMSRSAGRSRRWGRTRRPTGPRLPRTAGLHDDQRIPRSQPRHRRSHPSRDAESALWPACPGCRVPGAQADVFLIGWGGHVRELGPTGLRGRLMGRRPLEPDRVMPA
ncbi:hypothetical protein SAMN06272737_118114 [Blastococcus mobilis]|uniref:Uncharacterized protein n=1 Tax=Blastococcus mobilis TaxID=1938746 RepID=A0A238YAQ6_9ACTN|nr:hypothetical protein SAMN06272737_118114 [Blastococcus mobilis]